MNNLFETATRNKVRFQTPVGNLSVEQLWDLPLEKGTANLYALAEELQAAIKTKPAKALSFFKKATEKDTVAELKFEIVKHIVVTRVAEEEDKEQEKVLDTKRAELDALIAQKQQEAKSNMSLEDLQKMRAKLG